MSRLSEWVAGGLDPVKLAAKLGIECDPWQKAALRSSAPRLHLNCHRQSGKTTVTAVSAVHEALYKPGSLTLVVSPTQRQSSELFRKVLTFYRQMGKPVEPETENALSLTLENGSRVISVPGAESGIRTYACHLILIDEAARVGDEVFAAISPMVAVTGGRIIAMSTPAGRRGWWFEASLSPRWEHLTAKATECPRISVEFLEDELASLRSASFAQEYECQFADASGAAFDGSDIDAVFGPAPPRALPTAAPAVALGPTELQTARAMARHVRMTKGRREAVERSRGRTQRRCEHRWRDVTCVWCGAAREDQ